MKEKNYTKVWGDTVFLPELVCAAVIGIAVTMGFYGAIFYLLTRLTSLSASIASGYALMGGIAGCFLSGIITGRSFRPKRMVIEGTEEMELEKILAEAGTSAEVEAKLLAKEDKETLQELESLKLYSLLRLIPKDSPNYKPQYDKEAERGDQK